jgi:predicted Rossmann-fold nucleotide-binding protein
LPSRIAKIISGGQTGADRAALDAALESGIEIGGFVPRGRLAEDGPIPTTYPGLIETESDDPAERTQLNVIHSDGTLVFSHGEPGGGTKLTIEQAKKHCKPLLHIDFSTFDRDDVITDIKHWLESNRITLLNIAGPRASEDPSIYDETLEFMRQLFRNI